MRKISSVSSSSSATMSLLISTVAIGSMNRLAPVVEAPWTMPGIAALCSARTIRTKRPCRLVTTWSWRYLAVSRPLANWSSVVRSLSVAGAADRESSQGRAGLVDDLAVDVDRAAHRRDLVGERREAGDQTLQDGEVPGRARHRLLRLGDRGDEVGEDAQLQRFERPALDPQPVERRRQPGPGAQREHADAARRNRRSQWSPPTTGRRRRDRSAAVRRASAPCRPASARSSPGPR